MYHNFLQMCVTLPKFYIFPFFDCPAHSPHGDFFFRSCRQGKQGIMFSQALKNPVTVQVTGRKMPVRQPGPAGIPAAEAASNAVYRTVILPFTGTCRETEPGNLFRFLQNHGQVVQVHGIGIARLIRQAHCQADPHIVPDILPGYMLNRIKSHTVVPESQCPVSRLMLETDGQVVFPFRYKTMDNDIGAHLLHAKRQMPLQFCRAASAPVTRPLAERWSPGAAQFHSVMQKGLPNTRRHVAPGGISKGPSSTKGASGCWAPFLST